MRRVGMWGSFALRFSGGWRGLFTAIDASVWHTAIGVKRFALAGVFWGAGILAGAVMGWRAWRWWAVATGCFVGGGLGTGG